MINWGFIYVFKICNKEYVGITFDLKQRFKDHFNVKNSNKYFHNALRKYFPIDKNCFKILEVHKNTGNEKEFEKLLFLREKFQIKNRNTYDPKQKIGWNLTEGGEGSLGWTPSQETKNLMKEKRKKYLKEHPKEMRGKQHPFWGKKHLEKTKKLQSEKRRIFLQEYPKVKEKLKGETNPNAKLTKENVIEIRKLINENKIPRKEIFSYFNISKKQFYRIKNNESWRDLII
jgi:hypothetical protein